MRTTSNHIIAMLPAGERQTLLGQCQSVELPAGTRLYAPESEGRKVYFPETGAISMRICSEEAPLLEVALLGAESMVGLHQYLGGHSTAVEAVVFIAARARCCTAAGLRALARRHAAMEGVLERYLVFTLEQLVGKTICLQCHDVHSRLASWLLCALDRGNGYTLEATQESMAQLLGVRRVSVTVAAHQLQLSGHIRYSRGQVTLVDRPGLERAACSCYASTRLAYARAMHPLSQPSP